MIILLCVCSMLSSVLSSNSFDVDYYLGVIRSAVCRGRFNDDCNIYCHRAPSVCHLGECYCHHSALDQVRDDSEEEIVTPMLHSQDIDKIEDIEKRPALRHHITHFCPNLKIAADCVRTCRSQGKPAFCGKDHKCYCGHRYDHNTKEPQAKAMEKYVEFKDLYQKYYGSGPKSNTGEIVEARN